ncbi:hypothetical protein [Meiothermus sp.]|uniref:hypothetical protein n=1 Tax=Meiothermus sp. TaxID=1955249 RepID=UPI0021DE8EAC|nr:hypothetical protein [Meiothermus sp.]GIW24240.1 MAG: hypothetical protein KatS3mg069_0507 [Meiothermus sp.]
MKLFWAELIDAASPPALRRKGLLQLSALTLVLQGVHLAVAWLAVPFLPDLPRWVAWAVSGFFGLILLVVGLHLSRLSLRQPVQQIFLAALWLGVACLAAIFAARMGLKLEVGLFLAFGLVGYGMALGRLWFGLDKA